MNTIGSKYYYDKSIDIYSGLYIIYKSIYIRDIL